MSKKNFAAISGGACHYLFSPAFSLSIIDCSTFNCMLLLFADVFSTQTANRLVTICNTTDFSLLLAFRNELPKVKILN